MSKLIALKSLKLIKLSKLVGLGYNKKGEAQWITNLSKLILNTHSDLVTQKFIKDKFSNQYKILSNVSVESDGHSGNTDMYTKAIVSSIISNKDWAQTHVHLNYSTVFEHFYHGGFQHLANSLLTYSFNKPDEFEYLDKFNFNIKKQSKITKQDLLPLLKIADGKKYLL
jgi:hypothetical protein